MVIAIGIIVFLSIGFAFLSLVKELKKPEERKAKEVKKTLEKGRVIFYSHSSSGE